MLLPHSRRALMEHGHRQQHDTVREVRGGGRTEPTAEPRRVPGTSGVFVEVHLSGGHVEKVQLPSAYSGLTSVGGQLAERVRGW